ncbi:MAG TPA: LuxR C-terminal-related transcriptional regulator [Chloroflexia bacterium]|jgi:predicted ATPase/DNA-binding CsgD family transcriptional regulator|nr:LuxR C-terminal-related transcriptional regulator [Chloroflexia bacterium]
MMNRSIYTPAYGTLPNLRHRANALPVQLTPLIGREQEIEEVAHLLNDPGVRLLTLTGPPGVGKSRLALHAANTVLGSFPDGAYAVALRDEHDTAGVLARLVSALQLDRDEPDEASESIRANLQGKRVLLLLDDFEQAIEAAPLVLDLLVACPGVKVLATSRSPLYVHGEQVFPVAPLSLPVEPAGSGEAQHSDAVALFVERARSVKPGFQLSRQNASIVGEICTAVDGLPLAIELAAARINLMPLPAIAAWLQSSQPLDLLVTPGPRLPGSHRDLRSTLERSYRLLGPDEQRLFRHLSVFVGSCTLQAAEAVCSDDHVAPHRLGQEVLKSAQSLSDKGLLYYKELQPGQWRVSMLGLIREFAREMLEEHGEAEAARRRHARYFVTLAEEIERETMSARAKATFDRVEPDQPNLMSAIDWALASEETHEIAARIATRIYFFWEARNYCKAGLEKLETLAAAPTMQARTEMRASILNGVGRLRLWHSTPALAAQAFDEALAMYRELGDSVGASIALVGQAQVARKLGDLDRARALSNEALQLRRHSGERWLVAQSVTHLALLSAEAGEPEYAAALTVRGIALFKSMGANCWVTTLMESLDKLCEELAYQIHTPESFQEITDDLDELWEVHKPNKPQVEQVAQGHTQLEIGGPAGRRGPGEEVGQAREAAVEQATTTVEGHLSSLTPREVEVLRLLARGLTNVQMAEELMVSRHTIDVHIRSIYGKINVHSRSAATRKAVAEGLI